MLNRPNPDQVARSIEMIDEITLDPRTMPKTSGAIPGMSAGKSPSMDSINVEHLSADKTTSVDTLPYRFGKVWL